MRTGRGLIASLGVSISLIAAGSLALLAVSTVVAFKGWPDTAARSTAQRTTAIAPAVPDGPSRAARAKPIKLAAAIRPGSSAARPRPTRATARRRTGAVLPVTAVRTPPVASSVGQTGAGAAATPARTSPEPAAKLGDGVRETTSSLGATTSDTTKTLGEAVGPTAPVVGKTVDSVGTLLNETLTGLGKTVGKVVDGLAGN